MASIYQRLSGFIHRDLEAYKVSGPMIAELTVVIIALASRSSAGLMLFPELAGLLT